MIKEPWVPWRCRLTRRGTWGESALSIRREEGRIGFRPRGTKCTSAGVVRHGRESLTLLLLPLFPKALPGTLSPCGTCCSVVTWSRTTNRVVRMICALLDATARRRYGETLGVVKMHCPPTCDSTLPDAVVVSE